MLHMRHVANYNPSEAYINERNNVCSPLVLAGFGITGCSMEYLTIVSSVSR